MAPDVIASLLKLPAADRVELAMALWESLGESDRGNAVGLTPERLADLERRSDEHRTDPATAIPWSEVRAKLSIKK